MSSEAPETLEEARRVYKSIQVSCPTLTDSLQPDFRLVSSEKCEMGNDGHCNECEHFVGACSEDGAFFAHGLYEGFCNPLNK